MPARRPASRKQKIRPGRPERFVSIRAPEFVPLSTEFSVAVGLTLEDVTGGVVVERDSFGPVELDLPSSAAGWELDVVLSAPGFEFVDGRNSARIRLLPTMDSSPATFHLKAPAKLSSQRHVRIYATFWHEAVYITRAFRIVTIGSRAENRGSPLAAPGVAEARPTEFDLDLSEPDLTVYVLELPSSEGREAEIILASRYLRPSSTRYRIKPGMRAWLEDAYAMFAAAGRGQEGPVAPASKNWPNSRRADLLLQGFGTELYERFAPAAFKDAYWSLRDLLGSEFDSIQVFTNSPILPWELMRPHRESDQAGFLGVEHRVARWHLSDSLQARPRPPQELLLSEVRLLAPSYGGRLALPAQALEIGSVERFGRTRLRRWSARVEEFGAIFDTPSALIHYAGHGRIADGGRGRASFEILLDDGALDPRAWRGMRRPTARHLVFFNACDLGRSDRVAGFVDGWAPALLNAGASGYVGAMWPVGDRNAADFAAHFYRNLAASLQEGPALVADVVRQTRAELNRDNAATFLSYVYYGDPELRVVYLPH